MDVLEGIRVIDLTQALAGPYCTMMLGDLGADVIKIERPGSGEMSRGWAPPFVGSESAYFLSVNRNKRGLTLDLRKPEGQEIIAHLLDGADVFVTSLHKLDSVRRYGLDWETVQARNPRLIYCSITGYGHTGPYAGRGGYDVVAQGEAGLMSITGEPDGDPVRYPVPIADITTGIYSVVGILGALLVRERTGRGQYLDMSLLESQSAWLSVIAGGYFATGERPRRLGNAHPNIVPYQPFRAADKHIIVAVGSERLWRRFCDLLGIADTIGTDPRFKTNPDRIAHRSELVSQLQTIIEQHESDYWLEHLRAADIPCGPINFVDDTLNDPHLRARGMIVELEHPLVGLVRSVGDPVRLSETPVTYRRHPPLLGEHNVEILRELGYNQTAIDRFVADGVV